jgi:thiol-disulfide isomerase/thioredoxin
MKNIIITLLLLFAVYSCQEKNKENISEISITEEQIIEKRNEVFIRVNDTINSFFTNLRLDEMQAKPDMLYLGRKHNKTSVTIPTNSTVTIAGFDPAVSFSYNLTLEKGDSLFIDREMIKISQKKQIAYPIFKVPNGNRKWCELNFDYLLYKKNLKNNAIEIDTTKSFIRDKWHLEEMLDNSIKLLDSLKANNSISNDFHSISKTNHKLKFAAAKLRKAKNEKIELEIESLGIKLNDEKLVERKEYVDFLRTLILYEYFIDEKRVKNSVLFNFISEQETFLNNSAKEVLLNSYLKSIYFVEKNKFDEYLIRFNAVNQNLALKNKWSSIVAKENENSKKLNTNNRNIGVLTNLINDSELTFEEVLSKHKGKVVLVDFWASWCSPCRKEIPFLKELKSNFSDKELQIIEISIDTDYSAWVRASQIENLSGYENNYIIANWEKSKLYKNYKIQAIPRYLLFDKNGKIIDDDAPRPSDKELTERIKASI